MREKVSFDALKSLRAKGLTYGEISKITGLHRGSIHLRLNRTLEKGDPYKTHSVNAAQAEAAQLRTSGLTYREIGEILNVCTSRAWKLVNKPYQSKPQP